MLNAEAQNIVLEPAWKNKSEVRFERSKTRTDSQIGQPAQGRTPFTIKVLKADKSGYVISWRYGRSLISGTATSPSIEALQDLMDNLEYVIELEPDGRFKSLRNWQQVRDKTAKLIDQMFPSDKSADAASKSAAEQIKALFATKNNVESYLLREVQLFFMFYGQRLNPNEELEYDDLLPNPLGGPPFPAKARIKVLSVDKNKASLRYTLNFDREKSGKIIADSLAALAKRMGKDSGELTELASTLEISDEAQLLFDIKSKWPIRLTHERRIKLQGRSRVDLIEYQLRR